MEDGAEKFIPRGIRNNNPGNIKKNDVEWNGLVSKEEQNDNTFFIFKSPEYGIRALTKILITYRKTYDLYNIWGIINRYAPPSENNTEAYKEFLVDETNYAMLQTIPFTIEGYLPIVKAIIKMENGEQPYNDDTILKGMSLAWS